MAPLFSENPVALLNSSGLLFQFGLRKHIGGLELSLSEDSDSACLAWARSWVQSPAQLTDCTYLVIHGIIAHLWDLQESVLSSHQVGPGAGIQVISHGSKCFTVVFTVKPDSTQLFLLTFSFWLRIYFHVHIVFPLPDWFYI